MDDDDGKVLTFPATAATRRNRGGHAEWPESVRQLAYQFWAGDAARNPVRVADLLAAVDADVAVPERTVRHWANADGWGARADLDIASMGQVILHRAVARLVAGSPGAADYLVGVSAGTIAPDKIRVAAAAAILDRVGIGPRRVDGDNPLPLPASTDQHHDGPLDVTPAAAAERIRQRRQRWQDDT